MCDNGTKDVVDIITQHSATLCAVLCIKTTP